MEWKVPIRMMDYEERIAELEAENEQLEAALTKVENDVLYWQDVATVRKEHLDERKAELAKIKKIRDGYMLKNVRAREGIKRLIAVFDDGGDVHDLAHVIETELRPMVEGGER